MHCIKCKRGWHTDCACLSEAVADYVCVDCQNGVSPVGPRGNQSRMKLMREWHAEILAQKSIFLAEMRPFLVPFCGEAVVESAIQAAKRDGKKAPGRIITADSFQMRETPPYLTNIVLRDYQLEGVSTLISWFRRGVGGILADEVCSAACALFVQYLLNLLSLQ
jgi:hypothetical protein